MRERGDTHDAREERKGAEDGGVAPRCAGCMSMMLPAALDGVRILVVQHQLQLPHQR